MAFWLIATAVVATVATVGMGVATMVEGQNQADEAKRNQEHHTLLAAYVSYGQALVTAPGAVPT